MALTNTNSNKMRSYYGTEQGHWPLGNGWLISWAITGAGASEEINSRTGDDGIHKSLYNYDFILSRNSHSISLNFSSLFETIPQHNIDD